LNPMTTKKETTSKGRVLLDRELNNAIA